VCIRTSQSVGRKRRKGGSRCLAVKANCRGVEQKKGESKGQFGKKNANPEEFSRKKKNNEHPLWIEQSASGGGVKEGGVGVG